MEVSKTAPCKGSEGEIEVLHSRMANLESVACGRYFSKILLAPLNDGKDGRWDQFFMRAVGTREPAPESPVIRRCLENQNDSHR
jgi:hypothetical protein